MLSFDRLGCSIAHEREEFIYLVIPNPWLLLRQCCHLSRRYQKSCQSESVDNRTMKLSRKVIQRSSQKYQFCIVRKLWTQLFSKIPHSTTAKTNKKNTCHHIHKNFPILDLIQLLTITGKSYKHSQLEKLKSYAFSFNTYRICMKSVKCQRYFFSSSSSVRFASLAHFYLMWIFSSGFGWGIGRSDGIMDF
jgi:hypothetical protein